MTALLVSTVGISVQQIYCYCVGKTTFSLFESPVDACTQHQVEQKSGCCRKAARSCCAEKTMAQSAKRGCTSKSVKVFVLKTEYLVAHPLDKTFDCPIWADEFPVYLKQFRQVLCTVFISNKAPPNPPPAPPGRIICLRHEVFRC